MTRLVKTWTGKLSPQDWHEFLPLMGEIEQNFHPVLKRFHKWLRSAVFEDAVLGADAAGPTLLQMGVSDVALFENSVLTRYLRPLEIIARFCDDPITIQGAILHRSDILSVVWERVATENKALRNGTQHESLQKLNQIELEYANAGQQLTATQKELAELRGELNNALEELARVKQDNINLSTTLHSLNASEVNNLPERLQVALRKIPFINH